eukprot:jgi/Mesen1/1677/ME000137S00590
MADPTRVEAPAAHVSSPQSGQEGQNGQIGHDSDQYDSAGEEIPPPILSPSSLHSQQSLPPGSNTATVHPGSPNANELPTVILPPAELNPLAAPPPVRGGQRMKISSMTHFYMMRVVCLLTVVTGLNYLVWKMTMIVQHIGDAGPICILFFLTELIVFVCSLMLVLELSVPARERAAATIPPAGPFPFVSLFICCCKESVDIIQDTVRGALAQEYPSNRYTVWVLDDGGDDALQKWVEAVGQEEGGRLRYVRRPKPKGLPHHFKAGNINWGLTQAGGDYVAIFDADMIPNPFYITSILPHFTSEKIAFVQCPQAFYNIVKGDPLNDSSQDFYDVLLPYRDGRNSAQCVGTGVMMRASCLRENGGFTTGSITEDFDTAMSFHSRGYDTAYINQRLQAGLAPWSLEGYIKQHQRWATGSLQILFHRNPLLLMDKRFSLYRRVSYWYAGVQYYMNVIVLMILVLPPVILAFDFRIMVRGPVFTMTRLYVIFLVPYAVFSRLLCYGLFSRLPTAMMVQLRSEQVWYWMAPYNCMAILRFFFPFITKSFVATGSMKRTTSVLSRLATVWFHITYAVLSLGVVTWKLNMLVPVIYVLNAGNHPKSEDRKKMISYDKDGRPIIHQASLWPQKDNAMWLFFIIPTFWAAVLLFYFYAAIFNYSPPFCTKSKSLQWYSTSKLIGLDHWMVTIALVGFLLISASIYLSWRTYIIVHYFAKLTSVGLLYYAIEVLIFLNTLLFVMEICRPPREREQRRMPLDPLPPRVSIFVCCCNEALDVIQDTVVAAAHQDYPSNRYRVWVLDDGSDDNLKAWVEGVGVEEGGGSSIRYVRREKPKGKPHHFKAGNINNGLRLLAAELGGEKDEFVMLLDADMIPSTSILTRLLPHFENDNIAFVQCPQAFYNLADGDPLNDTALDFYNLILPCRDARNSAQCVGTGAVFRISSLQENGGFTTGSITEDFDTALHLHARGYKSIYVRERLQVGLVPWSFDAFVKQHQRWALGSLQILYKRNPLFMRSPGLSVYQRIVYWYTGFQYLLSLLVLVILVLPVVVVAFDLQAMVPVKHVNISKRHITLMNWYWLASFNCAAIWRFIVPSAPKAFEATGSTTRRQHTGIRFLTFHMAYCGIALLVVACKLLVTNYHDCGHLLKVAMWVPFILFEVQCMMVPIVYILRQQSHPKVEHRRELLIYDINGVPHAEPAQLDAHYSYWLMLFYILPMAWLGIVLACYYIALTGYNPPFCTYTQVFDSGNV